MKNFILFALFLVLFKISSSQEICDNGIDDDGNGLVDINDPACDCSIIPNPSFENYYNCPTAASQVNHLHNWIAAHNTPDFYNSCGVFISQMVNGYSPFPLIGGGNGYIGIYYSLLNPEYAGVCLNYPLIAGQQYNLTLYVARDAGATNVDLSLYGTPNCNDMPWSGNSLCPVGQGSWQELDTKTINLGSPNTQYSWHQCSFTFTPIVNINAITIGQTCNFSGTSGYVLIDNLKITPDTLVGQITRSGRFCDSNLVLISSSNLQNGSYQWYLNGAALIGETNGSLSVTPYGTGNYSCVTSISTGCQRSNDTVKTATITPSFNFTNQCFGDSIIFNNNSTISSGSIVSYLWNFGDGIVDSIYSNPSHQYNSTGLYNVSLTVTSDSSCSSTITDSISIFPNPMVDFSFNAACENAPISFNNLSSPITNSSWFWDFNADGIFDDTNQNPIHTYVNPSNAYPVQLVVIDYNNCENDTIINVPVNQIPQVDLMNDTNLCPGNFLLLEAGNQNSSFLWQDGSIKSSLLINQPGTYWVVVDSGTCMNADTVNIGFFEEDVFLSKDTVLCERDVLMLDLSYLTNSYHWQDNTNSTSYNIFEPGTYWITIENVCKESHDSISVSFKDCSCSLFIPNSFTPNNDGINDVFFINLSCLTEEFEFTIFNRWGDVLFITNDVLDPWDGTYNNKEVQEGIYVYKLTYKSKYTALKHTYGKVNLIR